MLKKIKKMKTQPTQSESPAQSRYSSAIQSLKGMKLGNPIKSIGVKLFLIIFSAILICVLIVGLFSYSTSKSIIQDKVTDSSSVAIAQSTGKLDLMFDNYENLTMQMLMDKNLQDELRVLTRSKDEYEKFQGKKKLTDMLFTYLMGNKTIAGGSIIPIKEGESGISFGITTLDVPAAQKSDWMKAIRDQDGRSIWLPTKLKGYNGDSNKATFAIGRVLKNLTTSESNFILIIEVYLDEIAKQLEDLQLGVGSDVTIIDQNHRVIFDQNEEHLEKEALVKIPAEETSGSFEMKAAGGEDLLTIYNTFESTKWHLVGSIPVDELVKDAKQIRNMTYMMAGLAALLAILIGLLVIRIVAIPLIKLRNLMNEGERGNLFVRSDVNKKDEIGQLSQSFNQMMAQITTLVTQANQSAQDVLATAGQLTEASKKTATSAREIAVATEEIAGGATNLAVEAEKGSDLTGEISQQMALVIHANEHMGAAASEVERASQQGTSYMNILIEKTGVTEEMTRSMVEKVDRLKESTRSIRKILEVLNNMTKQTNILSLNATIEAARAGAAGKGFMVVADEIRKLADQSRQSIDVVGQITDMIQKEIDETVLVLSDAYPIFKEQIQSVKEANQIFLTVQNHMGGFVTKLESVTESISNLNQSQQVLSGAMENVSAVAEEASATSQEVASLSNEQTSISEGLVELSDKLGTVSAELKESLSRFRTE
ncbi:methyl-accepting chemotaxis protein [Paenibacillus oenotherae]|uniref:Methyl-accepting chemotaxis protein n=1 Tax=Paenibacillus oenotherae TaxID=1435645 RepID=A0ABS7DEZ3_9BACL|nr:methyl-accepting chemotaxis protein [Paenibacillus oenotherae]